MKTTVILCLFLAAISFNLFTSCDQKRVFEDFKTLPSAIWNKDSTKVFSFSIFENKQKYNLLISVRNDISYSYSNLWLFVETIKPDGSISKETIDVAVAESDGKWLGKGFGGAKTLQVKFHPDFNFPFNGIYKIKISHGMRDENLKGVRDIGFRVEKQ
jgi:gliding motility-associated lipoprotein GldH